MLLSLVLSNRLLAGLKAAKPHKKGDKKYNVNVVLKDCNH
jgi:hypothetical protein